jgi:hypothetical protein
MPETRQAAAMSVIFFMKGQVGILKITSTKCLLQPLKKKTGFTGLLIF